MLDVGSGAPRHCGISAGVDDGLGPDRLAALGRLEDAPRNAFALHHRFAEPAVKTQVHLRLRDHVVGHTLPAVGVERHRVRDRLQPPTPVDVVASPAGPLVPERAVRAVAVLERWIDGGADPLRSTYSWARPRTVCRSPSIMS